MRWLKPFSKERRKRRAERGIKEAIGLPVGLPLRLPCTHGCGRVIQFKVEDVPWWPPAAPILVLPVESCPCEEGDGLP